MPPFISKKWGSPRSSPAGRIGVNSDVFCSDAVSGRGRAHAGWSACCRARWRATRCRRRCSWPARPAWASAGGGGRGRGDQLPRPANAAIWSATRAASARRAAASRAACIPTSSSSSRATPATIKIEPMRDVIDRAGFRPFEGRRRVVIIDEADAMVPQAQNALLKTLEEPPSASVFLLVSSMPDALLPTVRSRCPRLRFAALPVAEVATVLMRDHEYAAADARAAADAADGSIGRRAGSAARPTWSRPARRRARLLAQAARGADPARRIDAAKMLTPAQAVAAGSRARAAGGVPARDVVAAARSVASSACASTPARWPTPIWPATWTRWRARTTPGAARAPTRPSIRRWPRWSATPARRSWPTGWCWSCEAARRA